MDFKQTNPLKEIAFGAIAGMSAKLIEFPFDTIKVRLQSSPKFSRTSTVDVIKQTYLNEGFFNGFYKGLKAPLFGACMESAVLFFSYQICNSTISTQLHALKDETGNLPLWTYCLSGGFSGLSVSFVLTPIELIKCKLQVANLANASGEFTYFSVANHIMKHDGIQGLWRGLSSTMIKEVFGTAIWFGTYEFSVRYFMKLNNVEVLPDSQLLMSGALAGLVFNSTIFPIDTIKSNIQTMDVLKNIGSKNKLSSVMSEISSRPGGLRNLYNGLSITLMRAAPANAILFYIYELLKRQL